VKTFAPNPIAAAVSAVLLAVTLPLYAADEAPASEEQKAADQNKKDAKDNRQTSTVVITATRRSQAAHKVPFNVSAIGENQLREEGITNAKQLIADTPAIHSPGNSGRFNDSVTVRGLNVSAVNANQLEQFVRTTVGYYLDDTPLPHMNYRIKDVARVETLLGPQGTLYGAGSLGGTIRYITNRPSTREMEARVNTSIFQVKGGKLSNDTDAVVNVPLGEQLALRAAAARLDRIGYSHRLSVPNWGNDVLQWTPQPDPNTTLYKHDDRERTTGGRLALLWKPTKQLELLFSHTEQDQYAQGSTGATLVPLRVANATTEAERINAVRRNRAPACGGAGQPTCAFSSDYDTPYAVDDRTIVSRYPEFSDRRLKMDAVELNWTLGPVRLSSSTSVFKDNRDGQGDYASQGWIFYCSFGNLGGCNDGQGRSAYMRFDNRYKGFSHETRVQSLGDGPFSWIAGIYHTKQERSLKFDEVLPGMDAFLGADKARPSPRPDVGYSEDLAKEYKETALFGEVTYKLTDRWSMTGGARVFNYRDTARVDIVDWAGGFVDNQYEVTGGENGKAFFKFNTAFQINEDLLTYFTVSEGFRRGGVNGFKPVAGPISEDARLYKPDATRNYELGLKGYVFDRALLLQADVFQIDWKNVQTYFSQSVNDFPVNGTANGPDAVSRGFDLSAKLQLGDWRFTYTTGIARAKWAGTKTVCVYDESVAGNRQCQTWSEGGKLGGTPNWKHNVGVRWSGQLAGLDTFAAVDARYVGRVQSDRFDNNGGSMPLVYPSYTRFNARAGFSWDKLDVTLWVDNLTDKRAVVSNERGGMMGRRLYFTSPRTVGVNLSYAFK